MSNKSSSGSFQNTQFLRQAIMREKTTVIIMRGEGDTSEPSRHLNLPCLLCVALCVARAKQELHRKIAPEGIPR